MEKKVKKLTLKRESLELLEKNSLTTVAGAFTAPSCIEIFTYCFC